MTYDFLAFKCSFKEIVKKWVGICPDQHDCDHTPMPSMVSQKQLPKNWYPSSRSLVGVCLHFDCMRCIWRIFALFGTKVNPPFPLLLQDKPCWKMSLTALVLWTKVQSCFKGWLVISQVDRATFHFELQGSWTTCHQREIPHYPCHTQCSEKGHHLSLRLLLLWLDKKLRKVSSQNDEWDYWK